MWKEIPESETRLALRRLFALYLAVSGCALFFPRHSGPWALVALLHAVGVFLLLPSGPARSVADRLATAWPKVGAVLEDWYALILMPALYMELPLLNTAVHGGRFFDETILRWEATLFGGQPSQELAASLPNLLLSELLHGFYLSYYLIIYVPPLVLWLRRRVLDHQKMIFTLMLTFFAHYLFFVFLPVQGPRYLFPPPVDGLAQGPVYRLAHGILESGSSRGAAFPSSHVGVAVAQTGAAFLWLRAAAPWLLVATLGLTAGAVYAGFHYGTDALAGVVLGLSLVILSPRVARWLGRGEKGGDVS